MNTEKEVALITGAGSGVCREASYLFSSKGYIVVGVDIDEQKLNDTIKKINDDGAEGYAYKANVVSPEDLKKLARYVDEKFGRLDVLLNGVGMFGSTNELFDMSEEHIDRIIDVNLKSTYRCTKYLVPIMIKNRKGLIINIASMAGKIAHGVGGGIYAAAKWGVRGFSKSIDLELRRKYNIKVCIVNPGTINTPFHDKREKKLDKELMEKFLKPVDIAKACLFAAEQSENSMVQEIDVIPMSETVECIIK